MTGLGKSSWKVSEASWLGLVFLRHLAHAVQRTSSKCPAYVVAFCQNKDGRRTFGVTSESVCLEAQKEADGKVRFVMTVRCANSGLFNKPPFVAMSECSLYEKNQQNGLLSATGELLASTF